MSEFAKCLIGVLVKYYDRPYRDNNDGCTIGRVIRGREYIVHRYNHGLIYAIRQAFLAKAIIYLAIRRDDDLGRWLRRNCRSDPNFVSKVMFASAFQRSGRESEGSSEMLGQKYLEYELNDRTYFRAEATKSGLYSDYELAIYGDAILWETKGESHLKNILHAAHLLDLRRMPTFDVRRIKKEVNETLFESNDFDPIVDELFKISGLFLEATGDRDMMKGKRHLCDRFFILSNYHGVLGKVMNETFAECIKPAR